VWDSWKHERRSLVYRSCFQLSHTFPPREARRATASSSRRDTLIDSLTANPRIPRDPRRDLLRVLGVLCASACVAGDR